MKKIIKLASFIFPTLNVFLYSIFNASDKRTNIVFYSPWRFQARHLNTIIPKLTSDERYRVFLIGDFSEGFNAEYYKSTKHLPLHRKYSVFISTEGVIPWKIKTKSVYFGHGIGPKLGHNSLDIFSLFDYCFCPCEPIFLAQNQINSNCKQVGLPILEEQTTVEKSTVIERFQLKKDLPTIVYAPSWHINRAAISDIGKISKKLKELNNFNLIISPHPHLLNPDYCGGKSFASCFDGVKINGGSEISSLDLIKSTADIVVSDISSILYESLALGKRTVFDGNKELYTVSKAETVYNEMSKHVISCDWDADVNLQFESLYEDTELLSRQYAYIKTYIYNLNRSTQYCVDPIKDIVNT